MELLQLDRALAKLGPHQLSDAEIREVGRAASRTPMSKHVFTMSVVTNIFISTSQACYVRGINSYSLNMNQCRAWLSQWLQVSSSLKGEFHFGHFVTSVVVH